MAIQRSPLVLHHKRQVMRGSINSRPFAWTSCWKKVRYMSFETHRISWDVIVKVQKDEMVDTFRLTRVTPKTIREFTSSVNDFWNFLNFLIHLPNLINYAFCICCYLRSVKKPQKYWPRKLCERYSWHNDDFREDAKWQKYKGSINLFGFDWLKAWE